jgi:translation initiation factor 2B subunit (eIF-2B alpha/beta/delta family)
MSFLMSSASSLGDEFKLPGFDGQKKNWVPWKRVVMSFIGTHCSFVEDLVNVANVLQKHNHVFQGSSAMFFKDLTGRIGRRSKLDAKYKDLTDELMQTEDKIDAARRSRASCLEAVRVIRDDETKVSGDDKHAMAEYEKRATGYLSDIETLRKSCMDVRGRLRDVELAMSKVTSPPWVKDLLSKELMEFDVLEVTDKISNRRDVTYYKANRWLHTFLLTHLGKSKESPNDPIKIISTGLGGVKNDGMKAWLLLVAKYEQTGVLTKQRLLDQLSDYERNRKFSLGASLTDHMAELADLYEQLERMNVSFEDLQKVHTLFRTMPDSPDFRVITTSLRRQNMSFSEVMHALGNEIAQLAEDRKRTNPKSVSAVSLTSTQLARLKILEKKEQDFGKQNKLKQLKGSQQSNKSGSGKSQGQGSCVICEYKNIPVTQAHRVARCPNKSAQGVDCYTCGQPGHRSSDVICPRYDHARRTPRHPTAVSSVVMGPQA